MIWLTWRQFRTQALVGLAMLAAAAVGLLISGLKMHHSYTTNLAYCTPHADCSDVLGPFRQRYDSALNLLQLFVIAVPAMIGLFCGAPLIARELETGTDQIAWNQSVTRNHWLAVKLAAIVTASVSLAAAFSYLLTWWARPLDHITGNRFAAMTFSSRDIVPLAYAAFAFTLGATAGLLFRRTIPAMAVTLAVFTGIQIFIPTLVRPYLLPSTTITYAVNRANASRFTDLHTSGGGAEVHLGMPVPTGAWILASPVADNAAGHAIAAPLLGDCLFTGTSGPPSKDTAPAPGPVAACLTRYHLHESVTYQPASHYWPLQWLETGIYLALSVALSLVSFRWIRPRRT